jgi:hypothetical protein
VSPRPAVRTSWSSDKFLVAASVLFTAVACSSEAPHDDYALAIRVESDPGRPLAGATVSYAGKPAGKSDAKGVVVVRAHGAEGDVRSYQIACPEGHRAPGAPLSVILRRLAEEGRMPEYVVSCPPTERTVVVAVRADRGPNLPVRYLGREVARTDKTGVAHVSVKSAPEDTVELLIDTTEAPRLRPRNPSTRFRVGENDELFVFNQPFSLDAPRVSGPRAPRGPVRIGRGS